MQKLHETYGNEPLLLSIPFRNQALILAPQDVHRDLEATPTRFSRASVEKRAAFAHLEPKESLISEGAARTDRRRFNEDALDSRFLEVNWSSSGNRNPTFSGCRETRLAG